MNLQEAIQNLTGATARLEALTAERNTAQDSLTAAQARIVELEGQLSGAPTAAALTEAQTALTASQAQVAALTASQADFDARVTTAANAEAARIVAGNGHQQVETVAAKKDDGKPNVSGLTGLAKVKAAFANKNQSPVTA